MKVRNLVLLVGAVLWAGCDAPVTEPPPAADAEVAFDGSNPNECVAINTADESELEKLRHAGSNEDRIDEVIEMRPFNNVGQLLELSFWFDPRQPAEMVDDGDNPVCEFDVAAIEAPSGDARGRLLPNVNGVAYTTGRVHEGEGGETFNFEPGDRVIWAGFQTGGTTVADFRVFTTSELNDNFNWGGWRDQPHRGFAWEMPRGR